MEAKSLDMTKIRIKLVRGNQEIVFMAKIFAPSESQENSFEQRLNRGKRRRQLKISSN